MFSEMISRDFSLPLHYHGAGEHLRNRQVGQQTFLWLGARNMGETLAMNHRGERKKKKGLPSSKQTVCY